MEVDQAQIQERVQSSPDLPTLPTVVTKLFEIFRNPRADAGRVAAIISEDQSLTSKTLRLVNSAFYGFPSRIDNITRAIVIMGFSKVRNVALSASVLGALKTEKSDGESDFNAVGFWEHSLGVAITSEVLAKTLHGQETNDAFVCGLLHDLGKLIMAEFMEEEFQAVCEKVNQDGGLTLDAEEEILGFNHGLVGRWLADRWKFPPRIIAAIQYHHNPGAAKDGQDIASIVHVADILCRAIGIGDNGDDGIPEINEAAWDALELSTEIVDDCYKQVFEGLEKAKDFFDMIQE